MYTANLSLPRNFPIRIVKSIRGVRYFCLSDVCQFLGISRDKATNLIAHYLRDDATKYNGIDALMSHSIDGISYLFITATQLYVLMCLTEFEDRDAVSTFISGLECFEQVNRYCGED